MLGQWPPSRPETPAAALEPPPRPSSRMKLRAGFESPAPRPESRGPPPPPVPTRSTYPANTVREDNVDIAHHLNRASIQRLTEQADEESKEQIVEEWVRQTTEQYNNQTEEEQTIMTTTSKIDEIDKNLELEKFAQDVAETVVTNMEKHGTFPGAISNQVNTVFYSFHSQLIREFIFPRCTK